MHRLGLFPLRTVLLPGATLRLHVFEERYKAMIAGCLESGDPFGVVLDRNANEVGDALDPAGFGTTAQIGEVVRLPQGRMLIVTRGERRFRVDRVIGTKPFWSAEVSYVGEPLGSGDAATLQAIAADRFTDYLRALLALFGRELERIEMPEEAAAESYLIADTLQIDGPAKQRLLEIPSTLERLRAELSLLEHETTRLRDMAERGLRVDLGAAGRPALPVRFSLN
jgi:uncharacterized protein